MINLLSDDIKKSIRAARANTTLIRYLIFVGFSALFLVLACGTSYLILNDSKTNAEKTITNVQIKNSSYSPVAKQANDLVLNLSNAKTILDQQISYSTIIAEIANALPTDVVLESPLTLSDTTIGAPMVLKAYAKTSIGETSLKANFQKSSLFSHYSLQSITSNSTGSTNYPFLINFSITINKVTTR